VKKIIGLSESVDSDLGRKWNYCLAPLILATSALIIGYKIVYFGDIFPNTFYAKSGSPLDYVATLKNFLSSLPWLLMSVFLFRWKSIKGFAVAKFFGYFVIYVVYLKSNLAMNYADRFWFQLFWPLIIYSFSTNENIFGGLPPRNFVFSRANILSAVGLYWIVSGTVFKPLEYAGLVTYTPRILRSHASLGVYLSRHLPSNATVWLGDAGMIPYYAKRKTYDFVFLGTRKPTSEGVTAQFVRQKSPDVFVLQASGCTSEQTRQEQFANEISFIKSREYHYFGGFLTVEGYCMNVYARPDFSKYFANNEYELSKNYSNVNDRKRSSGVFEDLYFSYEYLFSPADRVGSRNKKP
jgi:hypothetical protein